MKPKFLSENFIMDVPNSLDGLVSQLRDLAIQIEADKSKIFRLQSGEDITELIKRLKTEEDLISLAHRIIDGTIPSTIGPYEDLNAETSGDDDDEDEDEDNKMDEGDDNKMDEGDDKEEDPVAKLLIENGYINMWDTWADMFVYFGYEKSEALKAFEMPSVYDISSVFNNTGPEDEEEVDLVEYFRIFISGKADNKILIYLMNCILVYYSDLYDWEKYEESAELEDDDDVNLDIKVIGDMVKGNLEVLEDVFENRYGANGDYFYAIIKRFRDDLGEHVDDVDAMMKIYGEIDEEIEKWEDMQFDEDEECDDECYDGCDNDCTHPCERHMDDIEEELIPYPILFCPRLSESRSDWTAKKRKVFDEISPTQEEVVMEEIRFEQTQTDLLLNPTSFKRLAKEIAKDISDVKLDDDAIKVLQEVSEAYLIEQFQEWNKNAIHANRTHINPSDIFKK